MNTLINSIRDLCKTTKKGNRWQDRESNSYIRKHIKYNSYLSYAIILNVNDINLIWVFHESFI